MMNDITVKSTPRHPLKLHPAALRTMHWINAVAMIVMSALQWHFFAMWILMINGLFYLGYGVITGRFRRKLWPIWPREVIANIRDALRFRLAHNDITHYNAVQKTLYLGIILVIIVQVVSGWVVWKPMQLSELTRLFYDFQGARLVHFIGMTAIVVFLIIHVALALLVPKTIGAMVTGGPRVNDRLEPAGAAIPPEPAE
jgi:thiosulfate reductase cytochrome b subunit